MFCRLWHRDITIGLAVGLLKKGRVGEGRAVIDVRCLVSSSVYFGYRIYMKVVGLADIWPTGHLDSPPVPFLFSASLSPACG